MIRSPTPLLNTKLKELPKNTTKRDLTPRTLRGLLTRVKPLSDRNRQRALLLIYALIRAFRRLHRWQLASNPTKPLERDVGDETTIVTDS